MSCPYNRLLEFLVAGCISPKLTSPVAEKFRRASQLSLLVGRSLKMIVSEGTSGAVGTEVVCLVYAVVPT
jgi:hypothetical protein